MIKKRILRRGRRSIAIRMRLVTTPLTAVRGRTAAILAGQLKRLSRKLLLCQLLNRLNKLLVVLARSERNRETLGTGSARTANTCT